MKKFEEWTWSVGKEEKLFYKVILIKSEEKIYNFAIVKRLL